MRLDKIPKELVGFIERNKVEFFHDDVAGVNGPNGWSKQLIEVFGGEGEGSTYYKVWSFTQNDDILYVKFNGWYESYNGADFDNYFVVAPKEKTITVYEPV